MPPGRTGSSCARRRQRRENPGRRWSWRSPSSKTRGVGKILGAVPDPVIGGSFRATDLTSNGCHADGRIKPRRILCLAGDEAQGNAQKAQTFEAVVAAPARVLVRPVTCRCASDVIGQLQLPEAVGDGLSARDAVHHLAAAEDARLGEILRRLRDREKAPVMAKTDCHFRGDAVPVRRREDAAKARSISDSRHEPPEGYEPLKPLDITCAFHRDRDRSAIADALDTQRKTVIQNPQRARRRPAARPPRRCL